MAKENLFDDIGLEDARRRLQEVSDYMDRVIDDRRVQMRQQNMKRDDLLDDPGWNFAHDVLEIIHCSAQESPLAEAIDWHIAGKLLSTLTVEVQVDTTELDKAIEKAEKLISLISGLKVGVSVGKPKVGDGVKVENITIYE